MSIGLTKAEKSAGYSLTKRVTGHCYARNGNVGNPTPKILWELWKDGQLVDSSPALGNLLKFWREEQYLEAHR
jgi:hypothetical protein